MKKIHTTGKGASEQQDCCGSCFSWVEPEDDYCWSCGSELGEGAYSLDDLKHEK